MSRLTDLLARLDLDPRVTVAANGSFVTDEPKEDSLPIPTSNTARHPATSAAVPTFGPWADHASTCRCNVCW